MYSGLLYVFKGGLGILQMLMWRLSDTTSERFKVR